MTAVAAPRNRTRRGARRRGICPGCKRDTHLVKSRGRGWDCWDCGHHHDASFPGVQLSQRRYDHGHIISLYRAGKTAVEIAAEVGCHDTTVFNVLRAAGVPTRRPLRHRKDAGTIRVHIPGELLDRYPEWSAHRIAAEAGCSHMTVLKHLRERGAHITRGRANVDRLESLQVERSMDAYRRAREADQMVRNGASYGQVAVRGLFAERNSARDAVLRYRAGAYLVQRRGLV
jgi:predicted transcriptional regulator